MTLRAVVEQFAQMVARKKQIKRRASVKLPVGKVPLVVGTVTSPRWKLPSRRQALACDVVELRLDQMPKLTDWLARGQAIEALDVPVIVTVRHKSEGGAWSATDKARVPLYDLALRHLSGVDVELQSSIVKEVCALAKKRRKCCIVSFHDFKKTPPLSQLKRVAARAQKLGSVIKITTMTRTEADVETLRRLLACKWKKPICVMGMGPLGGATRVEFPTLGSCLTYGYLDKPAAPGQLSAAQIVRWLRKAMPAYNKPSVSRQRRR